MDLDVTLLTKEKKEKRLKLAFVIAGVIALIMVIQGFIMYSTVSKYKSKIYPQVWVEDVYLGGMTKKEAKQAIIQKHNDIINKNAIIIKLNEKKYTIDLTKLNMSSNYSAIIDKAYSIGREGNIFQNYFDITSPDDRKFQLNYTYNSGVIDTFLNGMFKANDIKATDAAIIKNNSGELIVTKEKDGRSVDTISLKLDIKNKINDIELGNDLVIQTNLKKVEPRIKEKDLLGVNTRISSVTTNFGSSSENRCENIKIASGAINGKILMPGDIFSFNDVVGERSAERGYKVSKGIVNDKVVDDIGGGVCQVSTTLYNAILRTSMPSVERYHHTLPCSYIGTGLDATVSYGLLDYRFKNTYSYPIYIESIVQNKNITFNVYSNSILSNKTYDIINQVIGNNVQVSRVTYKNSKLFSKNLLYTDKVT
ncbi:MAG TPA: VanW family protein [Clostridium sp.]|uniref:VanW family protein n=1 Tax=Clostridium sp. TaxID=1506 RepID=UPI002F9210ED